MVLDYRLPSAIIATSELMSCQGRSIKYVLVVTSQPASCCSPIYYADGPRKRLR